MLPQDPDTALNECNFWKDLETGATNLLRCAPDGGVLNSSIAAPNPTVNYNGPMSQVAGFIANAQAL
ncbi:hypothetical protein BT63DRAFT_426859 [Microthyrium microscopicum]|uniref:Uncharacterized protein n=1 Tax=Microthyrium microscopicum TaxID=703497 RepID=A0A6A6U703_9PEZI|nr:hypothetical protein BT63DRAFT_426859 [Microthyrium microscopicum]